MPIVALSGLPADADRVKATGTSLFFQIPFEPERFRAGLEALIAHLGPVALEILEAGFHRVDVPLSAEVSL